MINQNTLRGMVLNINVFFSDRKDSVVKGETRSGSISSSPVRTWVRQGERLMVSRLPVQCGAGRVFADFQCQRMQKLFPALLSVIKWKVVLKAAYRFALALSVWVYPNMGIILQSHKERHIRRVCKGGCVAISASSAYLFMATLVRICYYWCHELSVSVTHTHTHDYICHCYVI